MEQRKFVICPVDSHISDVIRECNCCGRFFAQCCEIYKSSGSNSFYQSWKYGNCCHYNTSFVFTDGACSKNGQNDAKAGLGIVIGANREDCLSITVDNEVDYGATRTSQRAELLAAIEGLKNLEELHQSEKKKHTALQLYTVRNRTGLDISLSPIRSTLWRESQNGSQSGV